MTKLLAKNLYKGQANIDKRIDALFKSGQRVQAEMHKLACSVLAHLGEHKDIRTVQKFIAAMPDMARVNGLRNWFEQFGPIKFHEAEGKDAAPTATYVKGKAVDLGKAIDKPFWKFSAKEGQPYEPLNVETWAKAAIGKLQKDAKETGRDHSALIHALQYANNVGGKTGITPTAEKPAQAPAA
jgi:hypothetical protein